MMNFENLDRFAFSGVGRYDIPQIKPVKEYPSGEFTPANYLLTEKYPEDKTLHFFVDDYQFVRFWNTPDKYIPKLLRFKSVCAPDFSLYTDMPIAMQIYNHYRKHWLGAYWQMHGITVIPTISWSDEASFEWCFDGEPEGGVVAISSVGTQMNENARRLFMAGYNEMLKRLDPSAILFYGTVPKECTSDRIIPLMTFQDGLKKRTGSRKETGGVL